MASLLFASRASAEDTFGLAWRAQAGPRCITESALRSAVEQKLRRKPFAPPEHANILIEGEEEDLGDGRFRARVTQRDRGGALLGSRELEAQSCTSLLRAATLVVGLFIDPDRPRGSDDPPATPSHPASSEAPEAPPRPKTKKPTPPALVLWLGAGGAASTGFLPSWNGAVNVTARLERPASPWSFDWTASYSFPQTVEKGAARGQFAAVEQRVRACFEFSRLPHTGFDLCAGGLFAVVIPETSGVRQGSDASQAVFGPTAALATSFRHRGAALRVEAGVTLPQRRIAFTYANTERQIDRFYTTAGAAFFLALNGLHTIF